MYQALFGCKKGDILESFWGHLGQIWVHLEAQKQILEAILGLISLLFLAQNGPNTPKLRTVALAFNTQYLGEPLGAILG